MLLEKRHRQTCLTKGCHKPSIYMKKKPHKLSTKFNKAKHNKTRYACIGKNQLSVLMQNVIFVPEGGIVKPPRRSYFSAKALILVASESISSLGGKGGPGEQNRALQGMWRRRLCRFLRTRNFCFICHRKICYYINRNFRGKYQSRKKTLCLKWRHLRGETGVFSRNITVILEDLVLQLVWPIFLIW